MTDLFWNVRKETLRLRSNSLRFGCHVIRKEHPMRNKFVNDEQSLTFNPRLDGVGFLFYYGRAFAADASFQMQWFSMKAGFYVT
jgi:hypothetical protein